MLAIDLSGQDMLGNQNRGRYWLLICLVRTCLGIKIEFFLPLQPLTMLLCRKKKKKDIYIHIYFTCFLRSYSPHSTCTFFLLIGEAISPIYSVGLSVGHGHSGDVIAETVVCCLVIRHG